jgi:predicted RNase H-like HicB family nuclease
MKLTIAFFPEGEHWIAQCKEFDIASQAHTMQDIFSEIGRVLAAHVVVAHELGRAPFQFLPACPDDVWQKCVDRAEAIRAEIEGTDAE